MLVARIQSTQKGCDDRLKKLLEEQNEIKHKLGTLVKKDSPSFLQKDLGDLVHENQIKKELFVNTHGSEILTSVLVVVPKKRIEQFRSSYFLLLKEHYDNEFSNLEKRIYQQAKAIAQEKAENDEALQSEIIEKEFNAQMQEIKASRDQYGVVPMSEKFLNLEDNDGN